MAQKRKGNGITKRGGYEAGPKKVSELTPPPKRPGLGATPSGGSGKDSTKK